MGGKIFNHIMCLRIDAAVAEFLRADQLGEQQKEKAFQGKGLMKPVIRVLLYDGRQDRLCVETVAQREEHIIIVNRTGPPEKSEIRFSSWIKAFRVRSNSSGFRQKLIIRVSGC